MNYLHTKKPAVVHRDLKIQNVLVDDACIMKVSCTVPTHPNPHFPLFQPPYLPCRCRLGFLVSEFHYSDKEFKLALYKRKSKLQFDFCLYSSWPTLESVHGGRRRHGWCERLDKRLLGVPAHTLLLKNGKTSTFVATRLMMSMPWALLSGRFSQKKFHTVVTHLFPLNIW